MPTKVILAEQGGKGGGGSVVLSSIEVTTNPSKLSYLSGESFDTTGMIVTATYSIDGIPVTTQEVTGYTVEPSTLTDGVTQVTVKYTEGKVTATTNVKVTVIHKLLSIAVTTNPTKMSYEYQDTFATAGMVVTASYSDNTSTAVTSYSCSPTALNTVGNQAITITYSENNVTKTTSVTVTVNRKTVSVPTWKSNLTYNGSNQSVTSTTYWNNFNSSQMTIGGTTSAINAGTYPALFTLGSNYRWPDGTVTAKSVSWAINKAAGSLSLSPTSIALDGNNKTKTITVTRAGNGAISYSPTSVTGLTISLSGNVITVTGNGSTAISSATITVSVAAGTNYTAPANKTFTVSASYWSWGTETAIGDATWWAGLKTWAASATPAERAACVGKTKKVSLSTAVLGANAATMRCIGADQDGTGTLTFQTAGALPTNTVFGSNAVWIGSTARTQCQNFYNYCSAKNSIKTVSKGTCPNQDNSRNAAVTYNNETVWLPSEREMGLDSYSPISTANSTTAKAECTSGKNFAYSYYTSNTTRVKYTMSSDGTVGSSTIWYWERSRYYGTSGSSRVCYVGSGGAASDNAYGNSCGLAPAFVIG